MNKTIAKPNTKAAEFSFEDMYLEISRAWEQRAKELQSRRWHKLNKKYLDGVHVR